MQTKMMSMYQYLKGVMSLLKSDSLVCPKHRGATHSKAVGYKSIWACLLFYCCFRLLLGRKSNRFKINESHIILFTMRCTS